MKLEDTRLGPILEAVQQRAKQRRDAGSLESLLMAGLGQPTGGREAFVASLRCDSLSIVAEHKRMAPSAGILNLEDAVEARCYGYAKYGARALSVLTEQDYFDGRLEHLLRAGVVGLPRLRKDFLLDAWMVKESAAAGADAVLLMAVCLEGELLKELTCVAQEHGLAVLCEVHDAMELERAVVANPDCIGINARDLCSFVVDFETTLDLLPQVPECFVKVAESGIEKFEQLRLLRAAGADAALIGTALMRDARRLQDWTLRLEEDDRVLRLEEEEGR